MVVPTGNVSPDAGTLVTVTGPGQLSTPKILKVTMLSHPPTKVSGGHTIPGGIVSVVQVKVCEHVAVLPQSSVAMNVRVCVLVQLFVATAPSDEVIVGVPQSSVAVALLEGTEDGLHPRFVSGGQNVITGATESTVHVNTSVQVTVLPHASVAT